MLVLIGQSYPSPTSGYPPMGHPGGIGVLNTMPASPGGYATAVRKLLCTIPYISNLTQGIIRGAIYTLYVDTTTYVSGGKVYPVVIVTLAGPRPHIVCHTCTQSLGKDGEPWLTFLTDGCAILAESHAATTSLVAWGLPHAGKGRHFSVGRLYRNTEVASFFAFLRTPPSHKLR
jgi:hypothetical protein